MKNICYKMLLLFITPIALQGSFRPASFNNRGGGSSNRGPIMNNNFNQRFPQNMPSVSTGQTSQAPAANTQSAQTPSSVSGNANYYVSSTTFNTEEINETIKILNNLHSYILSPSKSVEIQGFYFVSPYNQSVTLKNARSITLSFQDTFRNYQVLVNMIKQACKNINQLQTNTVTQVLAQFYQAINSNAQGVYVGNYGGSTQDSSYFMQQLFEKVFGSVEHASRRPLLLAFAIIALDSTVYSLDSILQAMSQYMPATSLEQYLTLNSQGGYLNPQWTNYALVQNAAQATTGGTVNIGPVSNAINMIPQQNSQPWAPLY